MRLFSDSEPIIPGQYDPTDLSTDGRRRKRPLQPAPPPVRRAPPPKKKEAPVRRIGYGPGARVQVTTSDEDRTGLTLTSADTAGNQNITQFTGQTTAQHPFLCCAVRVKWMFANDPAATAENTSYLSYSSNPTIKGRPITDGAIKLQPGQSRTIYLAKPIRIRESTSLQHGTASLVGGGAAMTYSTVVEYLTELDLV